MSEKTKEYRDILKLALEAQDAGDEDREEYFMSKLDKLWLSMTAAEVKETESISRDLAQRSGMLTCAVFTNESRVARVLIFPVRFKTTSQISHSVCYA